MVNQLLGASAQAGMWLDIAIDVTIKGTIILLIASVLVYSFRRSAASRHLIWSLALGSFLALPLLALALPRWQVPILPASLVRSEDNTTAVNTVAESNAPERQPRHEARSATAQPAPIANAPKPVSTTSKQSLSWTVVLAMVWLAGAILVLGRLIIGTAAVKRIIRRASPINDAAWLRHAQALCIQLRISGSVALLKSDRLSMPLTSGSLNPAVLVPTEADEWTSERREVVLLHELAHVKRKDCLMQLIAHLACALYWFNPLVWVVTRQLRIERERACDDHVLGLGTRASDYASHLLELARTAGSAKCPTLAAVAMAKPSHLEGRLLAILDPKLNRRGLSRATISILAVLVAVIVLPLAAIQPLARTVAKSSPEVSTQTSENTNTVVNSQTQMVTRTTTEQNSNAAAAQTPQRVRDDGSGIPGGVGPMPMPTPTPTPTPMPMPTPTPTPTGSDHYNWGGQDKDKEKKSSDNPADAKVIDALIEALKDPSKEVRHQAIWALGQKGDSRAVDALMGALKDEDPNVRHQAAWALGQIESTRSTAALCASLKDSNATVRQQAAWALGQIEDKAAVDALVDALNDQSASVRHQAIWALGQIEDRRAVPGLINALKDPSDSIRHQAAWALGQIEDKSAVDGLIGALKDKSPSVRHQAAWALGQIADGRATDALIAAMKDEDSSVRQEAARALAQITSR